MQKIIGSVWRMRGLHRRKGVGASAAEILVVIEKAEAQPRRFLLRKNDHFVRVIASNVPRWMSIGERGVIETGRYRKEGICMFKRVWRRGKKMHAGEVLWWNWSERLADEEAKQRLFEAEL